MKLYDTTKDLNERCNRLYSQLEYLLKGNLTPTKEVTIKEGNAFIIIKGVHIRREYKKAISDFLKTAGARLEIKVFKVKITSEVIEFTATLRN